MKTKKSSYYKVGLGDKFLFRAKIIFSVILLLALGLSSIAVYAGLSTGQLYKVVFEPLKSAQQTLVASLKETIKTHPTPSLSNVEVNISNSNSTSTSSSTVKINNNGSIKNNTSNTQKANYIIPTKPPRVYSIPTLKPLPTFPPMKSWEQLQQEQEAWSKQKAAENDAWFQQQVEAAQKTQAEWAAQKQKELEDWKKQNGF